MKRFAVYDYDRQLMMPPTHATHDEATDNLDVRINNCLIVPFNDRGGALGLELEEDELATILAALRYWQQQGLADDPQLRSDYLHAVATGDDQVTSLTSESIDELCERLNCSEAEEVEETQVLFRCPRCGEEYWEPLSDLAEVGPPMCTDCDVVMQPVPKGEEAAS